MPTNTSPEYKQAEAEFKKARESNERLRWLREMLRTIPKHKGTERLQADIKTRIKQLSEELTGPKKAATGRGGASQVVRREGAAQVSFVGPPNSGKSSLLARLTGSHTEIGPYPYTTKSPVPGMLPYEDVHIQLIDLPPISADFMESWYVNALQTADAALLVVDLADPDCIDHIAAIRERLDAKHVTLEEEWPGPIDATLEREAPQHAGEGADDELPDPFRLHLPTLLVANKSDLDPEPGEVDVLEELLGVRYPAIAVSAETGQNLGRIAPFLFRGLGIVRVYTKVPGKPPEKDRPYTLRRGASVLDVAALVHRELATALKFAKIWGSGQFDGQQVGPDHLVEDKDVVELHA